MRARSGAVTAGAAGDLDRGDVAVASLVQMSASDRAGAVASPAEETPGDASVGRGAGDRRDAGREPASVARGARCFSARVFDRSFNGSSFDAHDGPVWCCRAVQRSNDCQTVAAHETSDRHRRSVTGIADRCCGLSLTVLGMELQQWSPVAMIFQLFSPATVLFTCAEPTLTGVWASNQTPKNSKT